METKQNPFSFYDFLGYFTPGAVFLYGALLVRAHTQSESEWSAYLNQSLSFEKAEIYIPFVLLAYIVGHVMSFLSSVTVERYSLWSSGYPSKYLLGVAVDGYFKVSEPRKLRLIVRLLNWLILFPISAIDLVLGQWLGFRKMYAKQLDPLLVQLIRHKMVALLVEHGELRSVPERSSEKYDDYFRFVYHYCVEHAKNHLPKMQNYVALYGFLRTLTLLSVAVFWMVAWHVWSENMSRIAGGGWVFGSAMLAYVLYMAFVKFYRRFSLEAFMALTASYPSRKNEQPTKSED